MTAHLFDDHSDVYESLVDWPTRLMREAAFYRPLFQAHDVQRVWDVACGTGHHANLFHQWGLDVQGADANEAMIQRARQTFGEPNSLRWCVRRFEHTEPTQLPPDAIICVGNSLALVADVHGAGHALHKMLMAVRPGGIVVVQVLNLQRLPDGPCVWQKCISMSRGGRQVLVTKGVQRSGTRGYVNLVICAVDPPALISSESVPLLALDPQQFAGWAEQSGATVLNCLGDYQSAPFDPATSCDLIVVLQAGQP